VGRAGRDTIKDRIGTVAAISIGVGGMIGAGIFSILGVVAQVSGAALPLSFIMGGMVALLAGYSYTKLGQRFPSVGGAVQFLVEGLGDGVASGGLNIFQYLAYVLAIALYARGFSGYAPTFFPAHVPNWLGQAFAIGIVLVFTGVNFLGAADTGKAETIIVVIKVAILAFFMTTALLFVEPSRVAVSHWPAGGVLFGAGVLFIGYEGFGLVTNAAGDMADPKRQLPRALFGAIAIVIVIYAGVAIGVIGNLPIPQLIRARDYALVAAARPFLEEFGFQLIAFAALLSTSSAVNATLFGAANISYQIDKDGQLPASFTRRLWDRNIEGLFITTGLVIMLVLSFDLGAIAMMGSAAFLLVYAAVDVAHLRILKKTGARPWLVWLSLLACGATFVYLTIYISERTPPAALATLWGALVLSFVVEWYTVPEVVGTLGRQFHGNLGEGPACARRSVCASTERATSTPTHPTGRPMKAFRTRSSGVPSPGRRHRYRG
jgi:amino acid transporter